MFAVSIAVSSSENSPMVAGQMPKLRSNARIPRHRPSHGLEEPGSSRDVSLVASPGEQFSVQDPLRVGKERKWLTYNVLMSPINQ
jgi:hypothetical protein